MTSMTHGITLRSPAFRPGLTGLCLLALVGLPVQSHAQPALERRDSRAMASAFEEKIEQFVGALAVEREHFEVRINRCEGARGELRDDIYAVWIGTRLAAEGDDAGRLLDQVRDGWVERGWDINRDRSLDNGGVNIAAVEPVSGDGYSLDSGFAPYPQRHIAGYFSTPCYQDPSGAAAFGPVD